MQGARSREQGAGGATTFKHEMEDATTKTNQRSTNKVVLLFSFFFFRRLLPRLQEDAWRQGKARSMSEGCRR